MINIINNWKKQKQHQTAPVPKKQPPTNTNVNNRSMKIQQIGPNVASQSQSSQSDEMTFV